jgi:hypothetical protein
MPNDSANAIPKVPAEIWLFATAAGWYTAGDTAPEQCYVMADSGEKARVVAKLLNRRFGDSSAPDEGEFCRPVRVA